MKQICGDCLHYNACAAWNIGSLANTDAGNCINFEHIHLYDSVEVVRCKDCYYWTKVDDEPKGVCVCHKRTNLQAVLMDLAPQTEKNDYCSWGERKEDET